MQVGIALLHHLLETATMQVPVLDSFGMPIPGEKKVHRSSHCRSLSALKASPVQDAASALAQCMVRAQRVACSTRTFHIPKMYLTLAVQEERVSWPETV